MQIFATKLQTLEWNDLQRSSFKDRPVAIALDKTRSDKTTIENAITIWKHLQKYIVEKIASQTQNLIDLTEQGQPLSEDERSDTMG